MCPQWSAVVGADHHSYKIATTTTTDLTLTYARQGFTMVFYTNFLSRSHHYSRAHPWYIDMISFIRHFSLIVPVPAFRSGPFLEFYLP